jgi:hypothetical protein
MAGQVGKRINGGINRKQRVFTMSKRQRKRHINRCWYVATYRYLQLGGMVKPWCHPDAVVSFADNVGF